MIIHVSFVFASLLLLFRQATSANTFQELDLKGIDQRSKSFFFNTTHVLVATQSMTYDMMKRIEIHMIDTRVNLIIKNILIGNQLYDNHSPTILVMQSWIYVSFISQQNSLLKFNMVILDSDLNLKGQEIFIGTPCQSKEFEVDFQQTHLVVLDQNIIALLWHSNSKEANIFQWNYREFNILNFTLTESIILPDSRQISVAKNSYGIRAIVQGTLRSLFISNLGQENILTTKQINYDQLGFIKVFSMPDNSFIMISMSDKFLLLQKFSYQFISLGDPILDQLNLDPAFILQSFFMINHDLLIFGQEQSDVSISYLNILEFIRDKKVLIFQEKRIKINGLTRMFNFFVNILKNQDFYLSLLYQNQNLKEKYKLIILKSELSNLVHQSVLNCKNYDIYMNCIECEKKYQLNIIDKNCLPICPKNCKYCSSPFYCDQCEIDFQYTSLNQCTIPSMNFVDLRISDDNQRKGKPRMLYIQNEIVIIYGIYGEIFSTLKIKKLNIEGKILQETELFIKSMQLCDYDITFGDDDLSFRLFVKWYSEEGGTIIEYFYKLKDLSNLKQQTISNSQKPQMLGDQILIEKITEFNISQVYYFYLSFNSTDLMYYLNYKIWTNQLNAERVIEKFYEDGLILDSFVKDEELFLFLQNKTFQTIYSISNEQINLREKLNFSQVQLSHQIKVYLDFFNYFQIMVNQYNNFELYFNSADQSKIQITKTSRNPRLVCAQKAGQSDIFVVWLGISNIEMKNIVEQVYLQRISLVTKSIYDIKKQICKNCLECNDQGICFECKNDKYQLIDGRCILICIDNCDKCEIETQCLVCKSFYYLNSNLKCVQDEQDYVSLLENISEMNLYYSKEILISVYLKQNSTRLEVIFEEFDYRESISGEIRISNDADYLVVKKQPKVIKKGFYYFISYLTQQITGLYQRVLVILNDAYQQCSRNIIASGLSAESDVYVTDTLSIYFFSIFTNHTEKYLRLQYYQFLNGNIQEQSNWQGYNEYNDEVQFKNLRFGSTQINSVVPLLFTSIKDGIEIDHFTTFDEVHQTLSGSVNHTYLEQYQNGFQYWTVLYDIINSTQVNLQFFNGNQVFQKEYIIGQQNRIYSFNLKISDSYIYFAFLEQNISTITVNLRQYNLSAHILNQIQIDTNEMQISALSMSINQYYIQLAWSQNLINKSYRALLNHQLQQIPIYSKICQANCKKCDLNQQCTLCHIGYYLDLNVCKPICSNNCQKCSIPYTCEYCKGNLKYIDNKCQEVQKQNQEQQICTETCYGVAQTLIFDNDTMIVTYQDYALLQYSIKVKSYKIDSSNSASINNLLETSEIISYHQLFQCTQGKFAIIWLSGNCSIQCKLMIQQFYQNFSNITNQIQLRTLTTDINQFNLSIKNYNTDFLFVWSEYDLNQILQIIVGQYSLSSEFTIKKVVQQNNNGVFQMPQLIIQNGYYQIIQIVNEDSINLMIVSESTVSYKQLYKAKNKITHISAVKQDNILVGWIETELDEWSTTKYKLILQLFDLEMNIIGPQQTLPTYNKQINNLLITTDLNNLFTVYFVETQNYNKMKIRTFMFDHGQIQNGLINNISSIVDQISHYVSNTLFNAYQSSYGQSLITFEGYLGNKKSIFIQELQSSNDYLIKCSENCYYCDFNKKCLLCEEGYEFTQNTCMQKLGDFCDAGSLGVCSKCNNGYQLTDFGQCIISDPAFQPIQLHNNQLINQQRLSSFQNGDFVVVWTQKIYFSDKKRAFMSLYNVNGEKLIGETRISLNIIEENEEFVDVQVISSDQFACVWFDGDLQIGAKIKIQRFSNTFTRIGDEILVEENVKIHSTVLKPLLIKSIFNGFVIVWTQRTLNINQLYINFYDHQANCFQRGKLNSDEQVENIEPVLAQNSEILVVLFCSKTQNNIKQIRMSTFGSNLIPKDSIILSENGEFPAVDVFDDGSFIFAWSEPYIDQFEIMSKKIVYKKYSADLRQQIFSGYLGETQFNQINPDVIHTNNGFVIIFENTSLMNKDVRNLKMQYFDLNGKKAFAQITVSSLQGMYPHHHQLIQLSLGQFIVNYIENMTAMVNNYYQVQLFVMETVKYVKLALFVKNVIKDLFQMILNIKNCLIYSSNFSECTVCEGGYILIQNTCRLPNQLDLSVEYITNIKWSFKQVVFEDGVIGFFWYDNYMIWLQKFNFSGYPLSLPVNISSINMNKNLFFDVLVFDDDLYLLALLDNGEITIKTFNQKNIQFGQSIITSGILYDEIIFNAYSISIQLHYIDELKVGLSYLNKDSNGFNLKMQILIKSLDINQEAQFSIYLVNPICLTSSRELEQLSQDALDIHIQDGQIRILKPVKYPTYYGYLYQIYDLQGHVLSSYRIPINNKRIDYTLLQLTSTKYIEAWILQESQHQEVYYQFKQFDDFTIAEPVKVSKEDYNNFDIKLIDFNDIIVLIWTYKNSSLEITRNINFNVLLIQKETGFPNLINLTFTPLNTQFKILQLPNKELIFSFFEFDYRGFPNLKSLKFGPDGKQSSMNPSRCNSKCQECDSKKKCLKCDNPQSYIILGDCFSLNSDCENFDSNCEDCLTGFYKTQQGTCKRLPYYTETNLFYDQTQPLNFKIIMYSNGDFILIYNVQKAWLEAILYSIDGKIIKQKFTLFINYNYNKTLLIDFEVLFNSDNTLSLLLMYCHNTIYDILNNCYYTHALYDKYFLQIESERIVYNIKGMLQNDFIESKIKQQSIDFVGIVIKTKSLIYYAVYTSKFTAFVGNFIFNYQNYLDKIQSEKPLEFDFISSKSNIVFAYTASKQESIIKIYDSDFKFIMDIILNDGLMIKLSVNLQQQFLVFTSWQINILTEDGIISSQKQELEIYPFSIAVNQNSIISHTLLSYSEVVQAQLIFLEPNKEGYSIYQQTQVNKLTKIVKLIGMWILRNDNIYILFQGTFTNSSSIQLFAARFNQYGRPQNISDIICPQNCYSCSRFDACENCEGGYQLNEKTKTCSKICTVVGCKTCEFNECDLCQDQMQLISGKCIFVNFQLFPNELQVKDACSQDIKLKILKITNNDFALIYYCHKVLTIKRFTKQNNLVFQYKNETEDLYDFDATSFKDQIYLVLVTKNTQDSALVYKLNSTWQFISSFSLFNCTKEQTCKINRVIIVNLSSFFSVFISGDIKVKDNYFTHNCFTASLISFEVDYIGIYQETMIAPSFSNLIYSCNKEKIEYITAWKDEIYGVFKNENGMSFSYIQWNRMQFQKHQVKEVYQQEEGFYFKTDSVSFYILSKVVGSKVWKFRIVDRFYNLIFSNNSFLIGEYQFCMTVTDVSVVITHWKIEEASVIQYQIFDKFGIFITKGYISNRPISKNPDLIKLSQNLVGFGWSGLTEALNYDISFTVLDEKGQFVQYTFGCSNKCDECISATWCTKCQDKYNIALQADKTSQFCKSSDPNCLAHSSVGTCISCAEFYILEEGECWLDQTQKNIIKVNQQSQLIQNYLNGVCFKDGSLLVVWSSINQDDNSWGIYGQLHNNQGQKIGNNIRVNQNTLVSQHSPRVIVLNDDTALIIYIDGNPQTQSYIKGIRYTNKLVRIENEFEFAKFTYVPLSFNFISLLNVELLYYGFVLGYVENTISFGDQIILLFYDNNFNQVSKQIIQPCFPPKKQGEQYFQIASSPANVIVAYFNLYSQQQANTYTLEGKLIDFRPMYILNQVKLFSKIDEYYVEVNLIQSSECLIKLLFYKQNYPQDERTIECNFTKNNINNQIQIFPYESGVFIGIYNWELQCIQQYFVDLQNKVTKLKDIIQISLDSQYFQPGFIFVKTQLNHYFIIYKQLTNQLSSKTDIFLQKISISGDQLRIDEISCPYNCLKCESNNMCATCLDQYKKNTDLICEPICEKNCSQCLSPQFCSICSNGYYQMIEGKCSKFPEGYQKAKLLLQLQLTEVLLRFDQNGENGFIIYTQSNTKFTLYLFQDMIHQKQIQALIPQIINYKKVSPFYLNNKFTLVFYFDEKIMVIRFDEEGKKVFESQIMLSQILKKYDYVLVQPIEEDRFSLDITVMEQQQNIYHAVLDNQFNLIRNPQIIYSGYLQYISEDAFYMDNYLIRQGKIVKLHHVKSFRFLNSTSKIFALSNYYFVQIIQQSKDVINQDQSQNLYYRILDDSYVPQTQEAKVMENNYKKEKLNNVLIFDDSFVILVEQINFYNQNKSQLIAQRFNNIGARIGPSNLINQYETNQLKASFRFDDKYVMIWLQKDNSSEINSIMAKKYDKNGSDLTGISCISNCAQCKNSENCEICKQKYELDKNNLCKLICPQNCNICMIENQCESCEEGYKIMDGQCEQIKCFINCDLCNQNGTCDKCSENYQLNGDNSQCLPICASNCSTCTKPLECNACASGFHLTPKGTCFEIGNLTIVPVIAYFENGDYIELWSQSGNDAGVYFQLYKKEGIIQGYPIKVSKTNQRRLLMENINQQFAADLVITQQQITILWLDASKQSTVANIQKFNQLGQQTTEIIQLGTYPYVDLSIIKQPCQIKEAGGNLVMAFFTQSNSSDYSLLIKTFDTELQIKSEQEIQNVNILSSPIISSQDGQIQLSYQSQGYICIQKFTKDGNPIDQPLIISDPNSLTMKTTTLKNGMIVFEWENKGIIHTLSYQLISKDMKTKSSIMNIEINNNAELSPDLKSFNEGFISVWQIIGIDNRSPILQFQIFNSLGGATTDIIDVMVDDGLYPINPSIQVINENIFAITYTGKQTQDSKIDAVFIQKFDLHGNKIEELPVKPQCSCNCQRCKSSLSCEECQEGYYLNEQKYCSVNCGDNCESCSIPLVCKQCQIGFILTDTKECQEIICQEGQIKNEISGQCQPKCPFQCEYCIETHNCLKCNNGYIISEGQCVLLIFDEDLSSQMFILIIVVSIQGVLLISFIFYALFERKKLKQIQVKLNHANQINEELKSEALRSVAIRNEVRESDMDKNI